jgi:uncharacterized membrane protein YGL010W
MIEMFVMSVLVFHCLLNVVNFSLVRLLCYGSSVNVNNDLHTFVLGLVFLFIGGNTFVLFLGLTANFRLF